ncbi:MAG: phosphoadenosine phosphosulfate reductase [Rhodobacter sp.]|nr:phosphoadenosine phosphosulfate reductase [Rhodobacter sp.]
MTQMIDNAEEGNDRPLQDGAQPDRISLLAMIERTGKDAGFFRALGNRHWAFFSDNGPVLLVTFETVVGIRHRTGGLPMGYALARDRGWSALCLIADGQTWYRDPAVYSFFDGLVDTAFFEGFDRVVFYGAGMGAYAACAFAVAAPGATVLALAPVATLDPALTGWDKRHARLRRLTFTDRYGYAPDMTEGAGDVFVVFDPTEPLDAMHAALFARPHVTALRARRIGPQVELALEGMQLLTPLITAACEGSLDAPLFHRLFRKRHSHGPYLDRLMDQLEKTGHRHLAARAARNGAMPVQSILFHQRLTDLTVDDGPLPPGGNIGTP